MKSRAALLTEIGKPLVLADIAIDESNLGYGQVLVRMIAAGICGAQLHEINGDKKTGPKPHPLGHEGVGIVERVGLGVTTVAPTNKVVLHWRKGEGIESDFPKYTYTTPGPADGSSFVNTITAGRVACWAERCVVSENRCTVVPDDAPDELSVLLGCSLSTALGTIEHEAKLLMGESVLIIGCGGLGLNLILAAKLRGARNIVVVETSPEKKELAISTGATIFCGAGHLEKIDMRDMFDVIVDTTGCPRAINEMLPYLGDSGRFVMVGQPKPGEAIHILNANHMFRGQGKTIMATQGGRFNPAFDVPRYVAAWRAGHLNVKGIVTHEFPLEKINEAIGLVRAGQAGRILIRP